MQQARDYLRFHGRVPVETVREAAKSDVNIIFGAIKNENLTDEVIVTVIATGFDDGEPTEDFEQDDIPKRRTPSTEDDLEIPPFLRNNDLF